MSDEDEVNKQDAPQDHRHTLLESLLDPRSLQNLMTFGAALLVLGLVTWMWAIGIFDNKIAVAVAMGAGTLALLAGGWTLLRFTRHHVAGQAVTLLACTIMPLNLWFYHAQHLVTIAGHLWVAGVVCCMLYTASALTLRKPVLVHVTLLGLTMTGLLILADENVRKLWEIAAPSTLLVAIGFLAIHLERAFPDDGEFSRKRFGRACFQSGIIIMTSGLMLLFGAYLAACFAEPAIQLLGLQSAPEIAENHALQLLALSLVLAGSYAYIYSDLFVRRSSVFVFAAAFNLLWAEVVAIRLLSIRIDEEVVIAALAITALMVNLLQATACRVNAGEKNTATESSGGSLARVGYLLGIFLCTLPVLLGIELHLRATYVFLNSSWPFSLGATYAIVMTLSALCSRAGAYIYRKQRPMLSEAYFFATAASTLLAARGLLALGGIQAPESIAPCLMLIPIAYMLASRYYQKSTSERPLVRVSHMTTALLIASVVLGAVDLIPQRVHEVAHDHHTNLLLSLFFGEATLFYALAFALNRKNSNLYLAITMSCGSVWQLLSYCDLPEEYFTLIFALAGLALLVSQRLFNRKPTDDSKKENPVENCGHALLSMTLVAGILLTLSRLAVAVDSIHPALLALLGLLSACSIIAAWLMRETHFRRWYIVAAIFEAGLSFLVLNVLSTLNMWEKLEYFSVALGLVLLIVGHIGWYRDRLNKQLDEWTSLCLGFGSVLAALPLTIAVIVERSNGAADWTVVRIANELGVLTIALLLLGTGTLLKLRATTVSGGLTIVAYVFSLLFYVHLPQKLQTVAVYMMLGGGAFFIIALLLSLYRDYVLALPEYVKGRHGIFSVLNWK